MTVSQEKLIISSLKYLQAEYRDGVPFNILKLDLGLSDDDFKEILLNLKDQGLVSIADEQIKIVEKVSEGDSKVEDYEDAELIKKEVDLSEKESKAWDLINKLADESGRTSRHLLEGNLLYGELKLSTLGVYNLITSLENKELLKKIQLTDGEYYSISK
ncbi:MAG: hypothetical protein ACXVZU_01765 [Methanobacteriaceae archaeon]